MTNNNTTTTPPRTLRDALHAHLADLPDKPVEITTTDGECHRGRIEGIGIDYLTLRNETGASRIACQHIIAIRDRNW